MKKTTLLAKGAKGLKTFLGISILSLAAHASFAVNPAHGRGLDFVSKSEAVVLKRFQEALEKEGKGARFYLKGKRVDAITLNDADQRARGANLTIRRQEKSVQSADAYITQLDGGFNTSMAFSVFFTTSQSWERHAVNIRERELPQNWDQFETEMKALYTPSESQTQLERLQAMRGFCVRVDGNVVSDDACRQRTSVYDGTDFASYESDHWDDYYTGSLTLSKPFRFGGSLYGTLTTNMDPTAQDIEKTGSTGLLETAIELGYRQWTSSLSVGFSSPLPMTKNFGEEGYWPSVAVKRAEYSKKGAEWTWESSINSVARDVELAYWDLVQGVLQLHVEMSHRGNMESQAQHTRRLYRAQRTTEYGMLQVEAELENARNQEEIAWNTVITRSNALAYLLDMPPESILFPQGFAEALQKKPQVDAEKAVQVALDNRAELKANRNDLDSAALYLRFAKKQLLPEISFVTTASLSQTDTVFGYPRATDSWGKLFDPDSNSYYVGLSYTYAWDDEAAEAAYAKARAGLTQTHDTRRNLEVTITRDVNTALASTLSSQAREDIARTNMNLTETAYGDALKLLELERMTEFELLEKLEDLRVARTAYIQAMVDSRKAYVRLLAAQGLLGGRS